jgi:hypothetical protein
MCPEVRAVPFCYKHIYIYIYIYTFGLEALYFCQIIKAIKNEYYIYIYTFTCFFVEFEAVGDYWNLCKAFGLFKGNFIQKTIIL